MVSFSVSVSARIAHGLQRVNGLVSFCLSEMFRSVITIIEGYLATTPGGRRVQEENFGGKQLKNA